MPHYPVLNRRTFLKLAGSSILGSSITLSSACSRATFFNPENDILLSGTTYNHDKAQQTALLAINLAIKEKKFIDTPFIPHGIFVSPKDKYRILCLGKNTTHGVIIDLRTEQIVHEFSTRPSFEFSGHAAFSKDGNLVYCIETNTDNHQGIISIRNTTDFNVIKTLPTLGINPHDCQRLDDNTLVISNTGYSTSGFHQPSLVKINLETEKLVERIKMDNATLNCGHFLITDHNDLVIASAPVNPIDSPYGGVSLKQVDNEIKTMRQPEAVISRMQGEALGIAVSPDSSIVAITHPEADLLTFWSLKKQAIIKAIGLEHPKGICLSQDKRNFIISFGKQPALARITVKDLTPITDSVLQHAQTSGEHLVNWTATIKKIMPSKVYD